MNPLKTMLCGVELKNPVLTASGTFGSGREYGELYDLNKLGGIITKGVSATPWPGNPPPRVDEVYGGMMNSVGLQNPGAAAFIREDIPFLRRFDTAVIVNLCGHTLQEYCDIVEKMSEQDVDLFELNISCPNIDRGGITFGTDCQQVSAVVSECKKRAKKPLIVKLSPNVTDIALMAKTAEDAGADAISLINTLMAMKIDIKTKKPVFANKKAGLSGPAIKPVAVRMVYEAAKAVQIPVVGMGGISTWEDAVEFMMAGATAVAVGTANFFNPMAAVEIIEGLNRYALANGLSQIKDIVGIID